MRFVVTASVLTLAACTTAASDERGHSSAATRGPSDAICQSHPMASFAQHRVTLIPGPAAEGRFDLSYDYWLADVPESAERWTLARGLACWGPSELGGHLRPVRRVRPPGPSVVLEPLVYCESADGAKQLLLQRETSPSWSPEGPVLAAEIVVLYDAPDLVDILPEPRRTILDTLYSSYTDETIGPGDAVHEFHTCSFSGAFGS
jgi:hypothetical protein